MKYLIMIIIYALVVKDDGNIISMPDPSLIDDMIQRMTTYRERYGLPPYIINEQLSHAAQDQADWLVATGMRTHFRPGGIGPSQRAKDFGYQPIGWCCGENYYLSIDATPDMVWDFWVWSKDHRVNLLHPTFQEVGIGMATNGTRHSYVLVFGNSNIETVQQSNIETVQQEEISLQIKIPDPVECSDMIHTIQRGETLFRIGQKYGVPVNQMAAQNNITDISKVYTGQRLCISDYTISQVISDDTPPLIQTDENWCYSGNRWGDGRCNQPNNPAYEQIMWECGWYRAHGEQHPNCGD